MSNAAALKLYQELKAKLHIADEEEKMYDSAAGPNTTAPGTHTSNSLIGPSPSEIDNTYKIKVNEYIRNWDVILLDPIHGTWYYDGTPSSSKVFAQKNGKTPAEFAQQYAEAFARSFTPVGKMQDLVKCLVEFWVMRVGMWKMRYANRQDVRDKWMAEVYDMSDADRTSLGIQDLVEWHSGGRMGVHELTLGQGAHQTKVWVLPLTKVEKGFAVKILHRALCHKTCSIGRQKWEEWVKDCTMHLVAKYGRGKVDRANVRFGTAAEMRAWYGLVPDPGASATERDIGFVVLSQERAWKARSG